MSEESHADKLWDNGYDMQDFYDYCKSLEEKLGRYETRMEIAGDSMDLASMEFLKIHDLCDKAGIAERHGGDKLSAAQRVEEMLFKVRTLEASVNILRSPH